jgi:hypothetical protein
MNGCDDVIETLKLLSRCIGHNFASVYYIILNMHESEIKNNNIVHSTLI